MRLTTRFVVFAAFLVLQIIPLTVHADVIISEIMYNPAGSDSDPTATPPFNREWVEIYNTGEEVVDLSGWQFGDSQDNTWATPFPDQTMIAPGAVLVVTGDGASFSAQWGSTVRRIEVADFPNLANNPSATDEIAALRDASGVIRDIVNYDDSGAWNRVNGSQGQSIFALPAGLTGTGNNVGAYWKPSMWGAYGARYISSNGENQASPGFVETVAQAPFEPSPDAAWSIVYLPDTQNYVKSSVDRPILSQMMNWIRDNREAYNIRAVLQGGDIVNNNDTDNPTSGDQTGDQQWANAREAFSILDGHVPYILAAGNHDHGTTNAQNRSTQMNTYFQASQNPLTDPAQGGILKGMMNPGELQNAYYEVEGPDGRKLLIFSLEWEPRPATVTWANGIAELPEYQDHTAVLLTHAYLLGNNTRYSGSRVEGDADGQVLWNNLVKPNGNFEMTLNGHFGGDGAGYMPSIGDDHNVVHQMFLNTQFETHGGDGWLRVLEFLNDGRTVRARTYSPFHDMFRTGSGMEFEFQLSPLAPPALTGDYNGDGRVDAGDFTIWRDTLGSTDQLAADGNDDGIVNAADYDVWKQNFGAAQLGAGQAVPNAVPEPAAIALLAASIMLAAGCARRRSGKTRLRLLADRY